MEIRNPGPGQKRQFAGGSSQGVWSVFRCCRTWARTAGRGGPATSPTLGPGQDARGDLEAQGQDPLGDSAVDARGLQVRHEAVTIQWQEAKQVVVWPDEAAAGKPRSPTRPWSQGQLAVSVSGGVL